MQVWFKRPAKADKALVSSCIQMKTDFTLLSNSASPFFFFLSKVYPQRNAELSDCYGLWGSICYSPAPASLHPLNMDSYESWHCVLPCSLLGFLSPTLSKAISFYLQYSSCLCTLLSSILHTLTQVLYFKGIKKWLYC